MPSSNKCLTSLEKLDSLPPITGKIKLEIIQVFEDRDELCF